MVIIPLIGIVAICVWILFYGYSLIWIMSCGDMEKKSTPAGTYYKLVWTDQEKWMMWFSVFMFFWMAAFIMAAS
jgi:hypothetical protein